VKFIAQSGHSFDKVGMPASFADFTVHFSHGKWLVLNEIAVVVSLLYT
jgi:hypothetical protein